MIKSLLLEKDESNICTHILALEKYSKLSMIFYAYSTEDRESLMPSRCGDTDDATRR